MSFVFPCLNEENTLADCIRAVQKSLDEGGFSYEVIVADNGSTDRSREIAEKCGARVTPVERRGYGAALRGGIEAARAPYVMFADADSTYLYEHSRALYEKAVEHDADMAIASRMTGEIEDGAMPPLHRHLGTPVLTGLINVLFRGKLTDCNSGFRCIRRSAFETWQIRSDGMEFASELLIKALKARAKTVEIDSGLRKDPPERVAHLRTWRDGMRHLLFILAERPEMFEITGLALMILCSILQLVAMVTGQVEVGQFAFFNLHSQALFLLGGLNGAQIYLLSCYIYLGQTKSGLGITRKLVDIGEAPLFFVLLGLFALEAVVILYLLGAWIAAGFGGISLIESFLAWIHFLGIATTLTIGLLGIHIFKKSR